ncbi:MAG: ankyrin repeat domain-containing protein [Parachlamydiaceae bacterium]|nr:ankyrin repeat domain-containing protein [Parachlamydiaceae bacterium]
MNYLKLQFANPWQSTFMYSSWKDSDGSLDVNNTVKNILNIVGCIPVASILSGIARIVFALINEEIHQQGSFNAHIFRASLEIGSVFGIALIIVDIYFTFAFREQLGSKANAIRKAYFRAEVKPIDLEPEVPEYSPGLSVIKDERDSFPAQLIEAVDQELQARNFDSVKHKKEHSPLNVIKPEEITGYRPGFSVIKDEQDRFLPTRLITYTLVGDEANYEEVTGRNQSALYRAREAPTPISMIQADTSPNNFFTLCEKQFKNFKLHHACDKLATNAFTSSVAIGNVELLKALIESAPELVDLEDENGLTPLIWACLFVGDPIISLEMVKHLIENGADINLSTKNSYCNLDLGPYFPRIERSSSALHVATLWEDDALVELLLINNAKLGHRIFLNQEEQKKMMDLYEGYPTPEMEPSFYNQSKEQVNNLFKISNKVTLEKCMPLIVGMKKNEIELPKDVVDMIIRIYRAVTPFW